MYAFESTNDFGHKTGYVADITTCVDLLQQRPGPDSFYPLETPILFDNLFERFQYEINASISSGVDFDSGLLFIARMYYLGRTQQLSNNYCVVQLKVVNSDQTIRIYYGVASSRTATLRNYKACSFTDYQNGTHAYNVGRIYLLRFRSPDQQSIATLLDQWTAVLMFGDIAGYIGTYQEPSSSYPNGRMFYIFSTYTLPSLIQTGTVEQNGFPSAGDGAAERRAAQPELVGVCQTAAYYPGNVASDKPMFVSSSGEYDPDPTPPTPPTPPGPGGDDPNDRDPEPSDKESTGGGPHTPHNDPLPIPGLPTVGAVSGGAFNVFKLTANEFNAFNGELYSDNAWTALKNYFNDPLDFMIGCIMVPAVAQSLGVLHPKFNSYVWSQAYARVIEQYVELNCGSIVCRAYYGSCFDYSPYTKVQLFLPFIGYVDLDPDEIMDMAVSIKYHIDVCTGDCVAFVSSTLVSENARVIGQYNGNCGTQIPVTRSNYDNVIAAGMNLLAASASAVGTYRAGGAAIGAASLTGASDAAIAGREIGLNAHLSSQLGAATMSAMAGSKSSVSRNGTLGGTCGLMSMLKPHLLVHTPRQSKPSNYMEMRGYPSNIGGVVGDFEGYLEVMDVRLNNIPATIDEINEIYELLKGGIII